MGIKDCIIMFPGKLPGKILVREQGLRLYAVEFPDSLPIRFHDGEPMEGTTAIEEIPARMGWNVLPFEGIPKADYVRLMNEYAALAAIHAPNVLPKDWRLPGESQGRHETKREDGAPLLELQLKLIRRISRGYLPREVLNEIQEKLNAHPVPKR